jgi:bifunctional non-homologous end joining protein LigD
LSAARAQTGCRKIAASCACRGRSGRRAHDPRRSAARGMRSRRSRRSCRRRRHRKEELAAYWAKVWERALAHLGRRPLKLVRHVNGTTFYHKGELPPVPEAVHRLTIEKREGGEGTRLWVDSLAGVLEIGAGELYAWNATVDDIEHRDMLVFDLDPSEGVAWAFVIETALMLRQMLKDEGLEPWPKLMGGRGLHLMAPLDRTMDHDQARAYAKQIAQRLAAAASDRYTPASAPGKRAGRIFIDHLRNGCGTTAIATWSPRALPGFPLRPQ